MSEEIETVLVAGYGLMGRGIALSFARGGHRTAVLSRDPSAARDVPEGVTVVGALPDVPPDLIVEALPEDMGLKLALFERIEAAYGDGPIVASNTSGLPLQELADPRRDPGRFLGIHYFHPAEAFPLVEMVRCAGTSDETVQRCVTALARNGQQAVIVNRPVVGFLFNRLQHAMLHEAFYLIQDGVCSPSDIDRFCRLLFGPRLCVTGLIEQKDISGLNTTAASQRSIIPSLYHNHQPCPLVQDMAARGEHGVKTEKGFYDWKGRDIDAMKATASEKFDRILAIVQEP